MAKRKPDEPKKGAPEWQCTFSDLMNLLLCFFVLLFSMSSVDVDKWEQVVASMAASFSVFSSGSASIGNGSLVGIGTSQLANLDEYYTSMGKTADETGEDIADKTENNPNVASGGAVMLEQIGGKTVDELLAEAGGKTLEELLAEALEQSAEQPDTQTGGKTVEELLAEVGGKTVDELLAESGGKTIEELVAEAGLTETGEKTAADDDASIAEAMAALENAGRNETMEMLDRISELTENYSIADQVEITMDSEGKYVEILIGGSLLFDSGKADLKPDSIPLLSRVGDILKVYSDRKVNIIGHTDNVPMTSKTYANNEILSSARAISAAMYLVNEKGVDVKRLSWTGRGEYDPVDTNSTAEGRARNRRIEIHIYNSYNSD